MKALAVALAFAAADPAPAPLKLEKPVAAQGDEATMKKRATDAVSGYYKALIAADYDAAATFLRPDAIEPIRQSLVAQIDAAKPAQQKATLQIFGVQDTAALRAMPTTKFFAAFARSQYGLSLQHLARKELEARITVKEARCTVAEKKCGVDFALHVKAPDGKPAEVPQQMIASELEGRWLLGFAPPSMPPPAR